MVLGILTLDPHVILLEYGIYYVSLLRLVLIGSFSQKGDMHVLCEELGKVRFQLSHGGYLDQDVVLFIPGMRVKFLSVLALEDAGYSTLFRRGHVYIFSDRDDLGHVYP